jgi:hypothetical protein
MTFSLLKQSMLAVQHISSTQVTQLKQELEDQHGRLTELIILASDDKEQVLKALAQAYRLPASFGTNFDALYDGLTDQDFVFEGLQALCILGLEECKLNSIERESLLDVLADVAAFWHDNNVQFLIFKVE